MFKTVKLLQLHLHFFKLCKATSISIFDLINRVSTFESQTRLFSLFLDFRQRLLSLDPRPINLQQVASENIYVLIDIHQFGRQIFKIWPKKHSMNRLWFVWSFRKAIFCRIQSDISVLPGVHVHCVTSSSE